MACALQFDGVNDYCDMSTAIVLPVGDTLTIKASANSGNDGGAYRLIGARVGYLSLIELTSAAINVRTGDGINNFVSTGYVQPPIGTPFIIELERLSSSLYEVRLDSAVIGQIGSTTAFVADQIAGLNSLNVFAGQIESVTNGNINSWDATSSNHGAGTPVLLDTVGGNNATGVNMPTDGSAWVDLGGGGAISIDLDSGSLSLTGNDLQLLKSSAILLSSGSLNLTGADLSLLKGRSISLDSGSLDLTGQPLALLKSSSLNPESGNLNLTGSQLTLTKNSAIQLNAGNLSLTGNAVSLLKNSHIDIDSGTLSLQGQSLGLTYTPLGNTVINLDTGILSLTGAPLGLFKNSSVNLDTGQLNLTGQELEFLTGKSITLDGGSLSLSGESLALIKSHKLDIESGNLSLSGKPISLTYSGLVIIEVGDFTVSYTSDTINLNYTNDNITINYE